MKTLTEAAASGDRLGTLEALRDSIAKAIEDEPSGRDVAALSKRLMEVMAEIDTIPQETTETDFEKVRAKASKRAKG